MDVKYRQLYRRLLRDSGIVTSVGIIVAAVGAVLGLGQVWVAGATILGTGILGILVILFWKLMEYLFSTE